MKVTLDHNCLINLEKKTETGGMIKDILSTGEYECFVVNIGASEMLQKGVTPDRYDLFENFLISLGLFSLPRLNPMAIEDLAFYDRCIYADDAMINLSEKISEILFPAGLASLRNDRRKIVNRLCDIHTMWCHIHYGNDVFLTTDQNFSKKTKLPELVSLGVKRVCHPNQLLGNETLDNHLSQSV